MSQKRREKHSDIGWGNRNSDRNQVPHFETKEEAMAYLRANPPTPGAFIGGLIIFAIFFSVLVSPVFISAYAMTLMRGGDDAYKAGQYDRAEAQYQKYLDFPLFTEKDKANEKLATVWLAAKKYDRAQPLLKELIAAHMAHLETASRRSSSKYSVYSEAAKLRYLVLNYGQLLAAQGKIKEVGPFQTTVWKDTFASCKGPRARRQIEKNVLDTMQGSLRHRGYEAEADALRDNKMAIREAGYTPEVQEEKDIALITSVMPPEPYENPVFCQDAMRD